MKFSYKSVNADGGVDEGIREANDQFALARELRTEGKTLVTAEEVGLRQLSCRSE